MIPTFPEISVRLFTLLLLACVPFSAAGQDAPRPFSPFTDHHQLPPNVVWIVQVEEPAVQLESEQGTALVAALDQAELLVETQRAWSRLARTLATDHRDAISMLGQRAQFIAGSRLIGLPWALTLEIKPAQRKQLIARLNAYPRTHRNARPISQLEGGRYLLSVFDRGETALVLLAPRSDRTLKPERDPKSALFFELFDRLDPHPAHDQADKPDTPLPGAIESIGPHEILIARLATDLAHHKDPADEPNTEQRTQSGGGDPASNPPPPSPSPVFMVLGLNRAAGGWSGQLAASRPTSTPPTRKPASLPIDALAAEPFTHSWVTLPPASGSLPFVSSEFFSVQSMIPAAPGSSRYLAVLNHPGTDEQSKTAVALVQLVESEQGPAMVDAAIASLLPTPQSPIAPDHAGRFPLAVRVQAFAPLAPNTEIAWRYSKPSNGTRVLAVVIAPKTKPGLNHSDAASLTERLLTAAQKDTVSKSPPVSGRLRIADLQRLYHQYLPPQSPPLAILSRIESVTWSLLPDEIEARPVLRGPVTLTLTHTRQGELGTKKQQ